METLNTIASLIPVQYAPWLALLPILGRAYYALKNGGGLKGVWNGLIFGTNTPNPPAK